MVTVPAGGTAEQVEAFLKRHRRWVIRQVSRVEQRHAGLPKVWPYGSQLPYRGDAYEVIVRPGQPGRVERDALRRELVVVTPSAGIAGARQVLQRWLKQEAEPVLGEQVRVWGGRMGLQAKRVYVRNLRSKWGSCWPGGSLSFNYRLIMAPPGILDYVVIHELAHLRQRNHSTDFWAIVGEHAQDYQRARSWLRIFGPSLAI